MAPWSLAGSTLEAAELVEAQSFTQSGESIPLMRKGGPKYGSTPVRWYVLLITCAAYFYHAFLWSQFGPIARSVGLLFGWTRRQIALFCLYGPVGIVFLAIPTGIFQDKIDIRRTTIAVWTMLFVSALMRCFEASVEVTTILSNISMVLCGIPGLLSLAMPIVVSAVWFPTDERMLSSSIGVLMNEFGTIAVFLIGPNVVPEPGTAPEDIILVDYLTYARGSTLVGFLFLVASIIYLPNKPKIPPAASAVESRLSFVETVKAMFRIKLFWLLSLALCLCLGPYYILVILMNIILEPMGISQVDAGYIGIATASIATACGFFFGWVAGKFGHAKVIVVALHVVAVVGCIWLLLYDHKLIPASTTGCGIAVVLYASGSSSVLGILQEIQADAVYPIPELITSLVAIGIACIPMSAIMAITAVDQIKVEWYFWCMLVTKLLGLLIVSCVKLEHHRTDVDIAGMKD